MGRLIFVIDQKVLQNFFTVLLVFFGVFFSSTSAPKNKSKPCLVSVVVLLRGCSGTGEYKAGREKITVYSLQKTRLHNNIVSRLRYVCFYHAHLSWLPV